MATRVPALIQLSDPRVAAQLVINKAKAAEKHKFIQELRAKENKDPKYFWQIINANSNKIKKTGNVTIEDFFDRFSELNSVVEINEGQTEDSPTSNETLTCNCITDKYSDMLLLSLRMK